MKWFLLFWVIIIVGFTACKKKSKTENAPPLSQIDLLNRTSWHSILARHEYYDASNNRLMKTNDSTGVLYNFAKGQVQVTNPGNIITMGSYSLTDNNGNENLAITVNNQTDNFEVDTLTENYLYLKETIKNCTYNYNGATYPAAYAVFTFNFKCGCQ